MPEHIKRPPKFRWKREAKRLFGHPYEREDGTFARTHFNDEFPDRDSFYHRLVGEIANQTLRVTVDQQDNRLNRATANYIDKLQVGAQRLLGKVALSELFAVDQANVLMSMDFEAGNYKQLRELIVVYESLSSRVAENYQQKAG